MYFAFSSFINMYNFLCVYWRVVFSLWRTKGEKTNKSESKIWMLNKSLNDCNTPVCLNTRSSSCYYDCHFNVKFLCLLGYIFSYFI